MDSMYRKTAVVIGLVLTSLVFLSLLQRTAGAEEQSIQILRPILSYRFDAGSYNPTYGYPNSSVVTDLTGDGSLEFVFCGPSGFEDSTLNIFHYREPGRYDRIWQSGINGCMFVAAADQGGDGDQELFVYSADGQVYVYDSTERELIGKFLVGDTQNDFENTPAGIAVANVDADRKLEIVVTNQKATKVYDAATYTLEWNAVNRGGFAVFVGNFDLDDPIEILVDGSSRFLLDARNRIVESRLPQSVRAISSVGNVDNDPQTEIAHGFQNGIYVYDPTTGSNRWSNTAYGSPFVLLADVTGDRQAEALFWQQQPEAGIAVLSGDEGLPQGFLPHPNYELAGFLTTGDLDDDGHIELIWAGRNIEQYLGDLFVGQWNPPQIEWQGVSPGKEVVTAAGDLDGNGQVELVVGGEGQIFIYDAVTGKLLQTIPLPDDLWSTALAVGQVDEDPAKEIISANDVYSNLVVIDGMSREIQWTSPNYDSKRIDGLIVTNMDSDPIDEILLGFSDLSAEMLDGAGSTIQWSTDPFYGEFKDVAIGDVNGDGYQDMILLGGNHWYLFRGPSWGEPHRGNTRGASAVAILNRDRTGPGEIMFARPEVGPNGEGYGRLDILDGITMDLIDNETIINGPDVYITHIEAVDIDQDGIVEYVLTGQIDNELIGPTGISTILRIDDWQSPYPWPEYQQIDRLGRPLALTIANMDTDPPLEIALGGPVHARVFDVTAEEIKAYYAHIPLAFNNHPAPQPGRFADDFSDSNSGWLVGSSDIAETGYIDGEYHIRVKAKDTLTSVLSPATFGVIDYNLDIDMRQVSDGDIAYGLLLDWTDWENYSVFLVAPQINRYALFRFQDGETDEVISWSSTNSLEEEGINHVRIERWSSYLNLYINGALVRETAYLDYFNAVPARVGLAVLTAGEEATAGFDNFLLVEVWPNDEATGLALDPLEDSLLHVKKMR